MTSKFCLPSKNTNLFNTDREIYNIVFTSFVTDLTTDPTEHYLAQNNFGVAIGWTGSSTNLLDMEEDGKYLDITAAQVSLSEQPDGSYLTSNII